LKLFRRKETANLLMNIKPDRPLRIVLGKKLQKDLQEERRGARLLVGSW
jgi:hypothetical protein